MLLELSLPPNCSCSLREREDGSGVVYSLTCPDDGTARGVWEHRRRFYSVMKSGDVLEVTGEVFAARTYPLG